MRDISFKAVIFDMDGLLIDSERLSYRSYVETAERHGLPSAFDPYKAMIGLNAVEGLPVLQSILPDRVDARSFKEEWVRGYRDLLDQGVPLKPYAMALITYLSELNIPMAVATSSRGEKARQVLGTAGIAPHMQAITGGNEVPFGKPSPDVYLASIAKLGERFPDVSADDCIAFEDSEAGVSAALAAQMRVIQIPDMIPAQRAPSNRHQIAATLGEGAALIGVDISGRNAN